MSSSYNTTSAGMASNSTTSGAASSNSTASGAAASGGSQAAAAQGGGGGGGGATVDELALLYHINLFLIALFAVIVLWRLPRALARSYKPSEWLRGHFLRNKPYSNAFTPTRAAHFDSPVKSAGTDYSTDESHTMYVSREGGLGFNEKGRMPVQTAYPPHVAASARFFRPLLRPLRARVQPGFSVAQVIICALWLATLVYPFFYKSTGPFTDPVRAGWVATSQVPWAFGLAAKNGVLGAFLGMGYEKLNWAHRFIARIIVLGINVHALGYIYKWCIEEVFMESIASPSMYWGLIGLIAFDGLFFFSTDFWRKKAYSVFICSHIVCISLVLPAMWLHRTAIHNYVWALIAIYGFDHLMRIFKTRFAVATIRPLPELGVTRLECPGLTSGWRAGQHVRVRMLSTGMGLFGWAEVHPFTIASAADSPEGLVLMIKKTGGWTNRLYEMAKRTGYESGVGRDVAVVIEGPYGGPGHTMFASFSAAVFMCGGSGITFATSAIQELLRQDYRAQSRVKVIELVWTVQDPASLVPLLPLFTSLLSQSVYTSMKISVYYTRAATGKFPINEEYLHPGLTISAGRPKFNKIMEANISKATSLGAGVKDNEPLSGMVVGVCGPLSLADDVSKAAAQVDPLRRDQVGGIDLVEEVFGW